MMGSGGGGAPTTASIYVCNLPPGTDEMLLAEHFGTIGVLKKDKRTGRAKIWIYRDKVTNEPKGDATVTYEDPYAAAAAVEWFNNKDFHGSIIGVFIAESKNKDAGEPAPVGIGIEQLVNGDDTSFGALGEDNGEAGWGGPGGRGGGRGEPAGKPWQQEGDWACPNPSCSNINFAFRGVCNRCGSARPAGSNAGGGGFGGGRGRGRRGGAEGGERGRGPGGPPGLFGPNDWTCPMCANINWAKRTKCNICNTTKPGLNEGGVREGRAGGYKEFDEAEIEETKRRRREAEDDDGEMYDEFGNLKKKFRVKAKQGETGFSSQAAIGTGKAGWDKEELGVVERKERCKENRDGDGRNVVQSLHDDNYNLYAKDGDYDANKRDRERHDHDRERHRDSYRDHVRDRERSRDHDHDYDRGRRTHEIYKEKERSFERDRERDVEKGRWKDRDRERGKSKERESGWLKERERGRDRLLD